MCKALKLAQCRQLKHSYADADMKKNSSIGIKGLGFGLVSWSDLSEEISSLNGDEFMS